MSLLQLQLQNVRCLASAELSLHLGVNLITGANGAGKTSLLEAVYLLGRGHSFRSRSAEPLTRRGSAQLAVVGLVQDRPTTTTPDPMPPLPQRIEVRYQPEAGLTARVNGEAVRSSAQLAEAFAVQVIDPGIHRLVEEGPAERRRWLDWTVFHVEHRFVLEWQAYARALRQRNAALQSGADPTPWEPELARHGEALTARRAAIIDQLQPIWAATLAALDLPPISLTFTPGWPGEQPLAQHLAAQRPGDRLAGRTRAGPHRCLIALSQEGRPARQSVSRGQQKLLGAALSLSAVRYVALRAGHTPTLLLDDPAAELDPPHAQTLLATVRALGGQQIVTALRIDEFRAAADQVFHVEHAAVKPV